MKTQSFALFILTLFFIMGCSSGKKKELAPQSTANTGKSMESAVEKKVVVPAPEAREQDTNKDKTICKQGEDVRQIEIEILSPKGCKVWYSKFGKKNQVASSINGKQHCDVVRSKMNSNLENGGFDCSQIEKESVASGAIPSASSKKQ